MEGPSGASTVFRISLSLTTGRRRNTCVLYIISTWLSKSQQILYFKDFKISFLIVPCLPEHLKYIASLL